MSKELEEVKVVKGKDSERKYQTGPVTCLLPIFDSTTQCTIVQLNADINSLSLISIHLY